MSDIIAVFKGKMVVGLYFDLKQEAQYLALKQPENEFKKVYHKITGSPSTGN